MTFWILLFFGLDGWILYKLFGWFGLLFLHDDRNDFDNDSYLDNDNDFDDFDDY